MLRKDISLFKPEASGDKHPKYHHYLSELIRDLVNFIIINRFTWTVI